MVSAKAASPRGAGSATGVGQYVFPRPWLAPLRRCRMVLSRENTTPAAAVCRPCDERRGWRAERACLCEERSRSAGERSWSRRIYRRITLVFPTGIRKSAGWFIVRRWRSSYSCSFPLPPRCPAPSCSGSEAHAAWAHRRSGPPTRCCTRPARPSPCCADGLTADTAVKAAPSLRHLLGTPTVAIADQAGLLACHGSDRHAEALARHLRGVVTSGRSQLLSASDLDCGHGGDCLMRAGVAVPIAVDGAVIGALAALGTVCRRGPDADRDRGRKVRVDAPCAC